MSRSRIELLLIGLATLGCAGCQSQKPAPPVAPLPAQGAGASPSSGQPATVATLPSTPKPHRYDRPPVEQDSTAGVRGTQMINFVATADGKPAVGAAVHVINAKRKSKADGKTDDWGEFHTALVPGIYNVTARWSGKLLQKKLTIDAATTEVDLAFKADSQP